MSIVYKSVLRKNPMRPDAPAKYYIAYKRVGVVNIEKLANLVSEKTSLQPDEVKLALNTACHEACECLLNGYTVELGKLGNLRVTAHSAGVATEAECMPYLVLKTNVRFKPGNDLIYTLNSKAQLVPATSFATKPKPKEDVAGV